jgi:predicted metal-dependent phosphoesterase TrpH
LIDLHTHTNASDGRCEPADLVARAKAAGIQVLSVTDHDTSAGCEAASAACAAAHIEFVPGIEITAVREEVDVHVLGYFVDSASPALREFLAEQRRRRIDRLRAMIDRLTSFGIRLDADELLQPGVADPRRAAGRPWIAQALVAGGHVSTTHEAFERWLARGQPAFVPRLAARPDEVFARVHAAGGIASVAHPGLVARDDWLADFAAAGVDAIECYHIAHAPEDTARYLDIAGRLHLAVSGGSDFHADDSHGATRPGLVSLPREHYERLVERASRYEPGRRATIRATASGSETSS